MHHYDNNNAATVAPPRPYSDPSVPAGPVMARVNEANTKLTDINEALDALEANLELALRGQTMAEGKNGDTGPSAIPPTRLVGALETLNNRMTTTLVRINDLNSRVHL
mgnify:CR=1 FL=1